MLSKLVEKLFLFFEHFPLNFKMTQVLLDVFNLILRVIYSTCYNN